MHEQEDLVPGDVETEDVEMVNVEDCPMSIDNENSLDTEYDPLLDTQWAHLPSPALEKIYSYLSRKDRWQMSLVCTRWSKEYSSPSIWHTIKFRLPDRNQPVDICPEVKFARKYGDMFRNVEIIYNRYVGTFRNRSRQSIIAIISRQLKLFLTTLTHHAQLSSVIFRNTGYFFRHLNYTECTEMCRTFVLFLESQQNLRTVEFHSSLFSYEQAAAILFAVTANSANTIRKLVIRGFADFEYKNGTSNDATTTNILYRTFEKLLNLSILETDYSRIFEGMFSSSTNISEAFENHHLSSISLHCYGSERIRYEGVSSTVWRNLKQSCPQLVVDLYLITSLQPSQDIRFYMVPDIPLRLLNFRLSKWLEPSNIEIDVLFNHIRRIQCNISLESLFLVWFRPILDLATVLVPFLQSCPRLQRLELSVKDSVNGIKPVLQSWLDVRPKSLDQVVISIYQLSDQEDFLTLFTIAEEYVPILKVLGLNVYLILKPFL